MTRLLSSGLVIAQLLLAAAIVLTARWDPPDYRIIVAATPGAALAIWAWLTMGLFRIRMQPTPNPAAELVRHGPYRWIRHPMYTGLLLFTAALVPSEFAYWKLAAWIALAGVLDVKARYEERLLLGQFAAYSAYIRRTARFLPPLY